MLPIDDISGVRWMMARNVGASTIPKCGLVEVSEATYVNGRMVLAVERPTADHVQPLAVNSWKPIPMSQYGIVTFDSPIIVAYDSAAPMTQGEEWGAKKDSYLATKDYLGGLVIGSIDSTNTLALLEMRRARHYKPYVKFTLQNSLSTAEESETATIEEQHGEGADSPYVGTGAITVHNHRIHTASTYSYTGDAGDWGTGRHMYGSHYLIVDMECP